MRQSFPDFATLLKNAETEHERAEYLRAPHSHLASAVFSAGFNSAPAEAAFTGKTLPQFDLNEADNADATGDKETSEIARRMENQSATTIRDELRLHPGMKRAELQRLRRSFAANNHPDRLPHEFRLAAEQRMKTANALLDSAMASAPNEL